MTENDALMTESDQKYIMYSTFSCFFLRQPLGAGEKKATGRRNHFFFLTKHSEIVFPLFLPPYRS